MAPGRNKNKKGKWKPIWGRSHATIDVAASAASTNLNPFGFNFTLSIQTQAEEETELPLFVSDKDSSTSNTQNLGLDHGTLGYRENGQTITSHEDFEAQRKSRTVRNPEMFFYKGNDAHNVLDSGTQSQLPQQASALNPETNRKTRGILSSTLQINRQAYEHFDTGQPVYQPEAAFDGWRNTRLQGGPANLGATKDSEPLLGGGPFWSSDGDESSSAEEAIDARLGHFRCNRGDNESNSPPTDDPRTPDALLPPGNIQQVTDTAEAEKRREAKRHSQSHLQCTSMIPKSIAPSHPIMYNRVMSELTTHALRSTTKSRSKSWTTEEEIAFEEAETDREADRFLASIPMSAKAAQQMYRDILQEETRRQGQRKGAAYKRCKRKGKTRRGIVKSSNVNAMGYRAHLYWRMLLFKD